MTKSRLPVFDPAALTPEQQRAYDAIKSGPRGDVLGPLRVWLRSPEMAQKAQALGQYARYDSVLPMMLSELAILVTGRIWSSGFEWAHHVPLALGAGVSQTVVDAIAHAERPIFDDTKQAAVFDFCVELHRDRQVTDATFLNAKSQLGEQAVVDLVSICGYYTLISMTINVFDVPMGYGPSLPVLAQPVSEWFQDSFTDDQ
jgi:4-carboxymuconolactone decarboxylase